MNQVAFKAVSGCTDALLHIDNYVTNALSSRNHAPILSIDFEKSFDRIGVHVIISSLKKWKVGPKIFNYVKSYLNGRNFRVKINGTHSALRLDKSSSSESSPLAPAGQWHSLSDC